MKHLVILGDHRILISTYNTELELSVLEEMWCENADDVHHEDDYFESFADEFLQTLTDYNIKKLTKIEKVLLIWKIRSLTIGDDINIVFKCPKCSRVIQKTISVDDICAYGEYAHLNIFEKNLISKQQLEDFDINDYDFEDMDYDEYLNISENTEQYFNVYNERIELKCSKCGNTVYDNLLTYKGCLRFISEDSFLSLTEWLNVLVYYGHLTRSDILKMSPIQRMLQIKYFKSIKEQENQNNVY